MKNFGIATLTLFIIGCSSNQPKDDAFEQILQEISESLKEEDKEEEYTEPDYYVEVMDNPLVVEGVQRDIDEIKSGPKSESDYNTSIGRRYVAGENQLRDEIVQLLSEEHSAEKQALFYDLNPYDHPTFKLTDRKIVDAVYDNLYDEESETHAISLIVGQEFPDYLDIFEAHLLAGDSYNPGQLVFWLGNDGRSEEVLDYFERNMHTVFEGDEVLAESLEGLNLLKENGSDAIKNGVFDVCLKIYDQRLIADEKFDELEDNYGYSNPAKHLLEILFDSNIEKMMPIAEKCWDYIGVGQNAMTYLIRMNAKNQRKKIISLMKDEETYSEGLALVSNFYEQTGDERMIKAAVTNFELLYGYERNYEDWQLSDLVDELIEIAGDTADQYLLDAFEDFGLEADALETFENNLQSIDDVANYLYEIGLLKQPLSNQVIRQAENEEYGANIYKVLEVSGIYFWFDYEEYSPIYDHQNIVEKYRNNSQGNLDGLDFALNYEVEDVGETEFFVTLGNKAYRMFSPTKDEWDYGYYKDINYLINFILADIGITERFICFGYDEYIFGTQEQVDQLKLDFSIDTYDEYY